MCCARTGRQGSERHALMNLNDALSVLCVAQSIFWFYGQQEPANTNANANVNALGCVEEGALKKKM